MAQNLVNEMSEGLTKSTANLVMNHRTYMEELPSRAMRNGYRPSANLTSADKQRMQRDKVHSMQVPWYNHTQGEKECLHSNHKGCKELEAFGNKDQDFFCVQQILPS